MLNLALNTIHTLLENIAIDGQPLIEKYGKLVFPISIPTSIGQTENGQEILKEQIFPVACGINFSECIQQRKYQQLVPSSAYKSLAYFEQLGDATMNVSEQKFAPKSGLMVYDIPVRLVVWLNMAKLNINDAGNEQCSIAAPVALKIQEVLFNNRNRFELGGAYENGTVEFIFQGMEAKDPQKIFGRYTYGKELAKFLLWPYDFFSLKYTVRVRINRNCIELFTLGTPVDCPVLSTGEGS